MSSKILADNFVGEYAYLSITDWRTKPLRGSHPIACFIGS